MPGVRQTNTGVVQTAGGVAETALATVLEDHEDGTNEYDGTTGVSVINDTSLEGSYLVDVGQYAEAAHSVETTSRGNTYKCRMIVNDAGGNPWFLVGVQDTANPISDCYYAVLQANNDEFILAERNSGSSTNHVVVNQTINANTEYRIEFEYAPTGSALVATLYDSSDSQLAQASHVDNTHTGGTFGFYGGGATNGAYADYITKL